MTDKIDLKPIKDKLQTDGPILILLSQNAQLDHVASGLALYLSLKDAGKDVQIASATELRAEFSRLIGLNQVSEEIGNKNLVISFGSFKFNSIEKISHNEGVGDEFELIIQPKAGQKAPDPKDIEFSFRGVSADLIFTIGAARLEDLGDLYEADRSLYNQATVVAFNRRQEPNFASISIIDNSASSLGEVMADFLTELGYTPREDIATNLLSAIDFATNRFQNPMISPQAFITAGQLMQAGAKRQPPRPNPVQLSGVGNRPPFLPFNQPSPGQTTFPGVNPNQNQPQQNQPPRRSGQNPKKSRNNSSNQNRNQSQQNPGNSSGRDPIPSPSRV